MKRLIKKSMLVGSIDKNGYQIDVYIEPSNIEFNNLITSTSFGYLHGLIDNNNIYIWDPTLAYDEMTSHFGLGNDGIRLTINHDSLTIDDSLGEEYVLDRLIIVKDFLCNMLYKTDQTLNISLTMSGKTMTLYTFLNGGVV